MSRQSGNERAMSDRGSASIWVLAGAALVLLAAFVFAVRATATLARHRAQAAADLAALAAAGQVGVGPDPCRVAADVARANAAVLHTCRVDYADNQRSGQISVTVASMIDLPITRSVAVFASARAARDPPGSSS